MSQINWERLARANTHATQLRVLERMLEVGEASPKRLSDELGERLGNVSYHMKELADAGMIELVRTEPRRGAVAHFYAPTAEAGGGGGR